MESYKPEVVKVENAEQIPPLTTKEAYVSLAIEIVGSAETFSFEGLSTEGLAALKQDEVDIPNYTDYATPVDDIIARMQSEGIKVVLGKDPQNVFVLPASSDNVERDSFRPNHLDANTITDPKLRALVIATQNWKSLT